MMMEKSAACVGEPPPHPLGGDYTVLDIGRGQQMLVKEALHIQMTPSEKHFNRDGGLKILVPGPL